MSPQKTLPPDPISSARRAHLLVRLAFGSDERFRGPLPRVPTAKNGRMVSRTAAQSRESGSGRGSVSVVPSAGLSEATSSTSLP